MLAVKGSLRRCAPLTAARRSGRSRIATGGSGGNTHGQPAHLEFAELDKHNIRVARRIAGTSLF